MRLWINYPQIDLGVGTRSSVSVQHLCRAERVAETYFKNYISLSGYGHKLVMAPALHCGVKLIVRPVRHSADSVVFVPFSHDIRDKCFLACNNLCRCWSRSNRL